MRFTEDQTTHKKVKLKINGQKLFKRKLKKGQQPKMNRASETDRTTLNNLTYKGKQP